MAYLMTYICSSCTRPIKRLCQAVTPEEPPWTYLDYCENCKQQRTFLRDIVHSDGFIDEPLMPLIPWHLYLMKAENGLYKIGISTNPKARYASLATGPIAIGLLWSKEMITAREVEQELHRHFQAKRIRGEWFELNEQDVEYIRRLADG